MGKKKDKDRSSFSKVLKENKKKIKVIVDSSSDEKTLQDVTDASIEGIVGTPIDSMVPITVTEAAESSVNDLPYTAIRTTYTDSLYSLYEMGIKTGQKQTLIIPLASNAVEDLDGDPNLSEIIYALKKSSNIGMIWDEFPRKIVKRAQAWADDEGGDTMFVIRIPNVCMFFNSIPRNKAARPLVFDIIIAITNASTKSLKRAKKMQEDNIETFSATFASDLVKVIGNFGASSVHIPVWLDFYRNEDAASSAWVEALKEGKPSTLKRLSFATPDAVTLLSFNRGLIEGINKTDCGMKIV